MLKILKPGTKQLVTEAIAILVKTALREKDENLASLQAQKAKKMSMRFRVRLPYEVRQLYCKKCKAFIIPGKSARVRTGRAKTRAIRITCNHCGHTYRRVLG